MSMIPIGVEVDGFRRPARDALRQAAELGHSLDHELRCLLLHGVLHCLGHDHETDDGDMRRLELRLRETWIDGVGERSS